MNPRYLINKAREYGLEIISRSELMTMYNNRMFKSGTGTFEDIYNGLLETHFENMNVGYKKNNRLKIYINLKL